MFSVHLQVKKDEEGRLDNMSRATSLNPLTGEMNYILGDLLIIK